MPTVGTRTKGQGKTGRPPRDHFVVDAETGCHIWVGAMRDKLGYGHLRRNNKRHAAHRWYYEQAKGPIPSHLELDHLCRRPSCVNPDHLEAVTTAVNQQRGANAKVNWEIVRYIRANCVLRHPEFGYHALGRQFGLCPEAIRKIVNNTSWVEEPMAS